MGGDLMTGVGGVRELEVAADLSFPVAAVTEPIGVFGQRGYGKTWTAVRIVEQLYAAGLPSVVLDVKGDWWGIRSSRDGKRAGLPFLIFGGDHADVPLDPGSARTVARFIAERGIPAVIDLSMLSKTKARQWAMEFAETLYDLKRQHRSPLMLVVDEADVLIPQRLAADLMRLLGAMEDIAKRGRQRGLGILIVSQRVADVNKSVTDLLTTLIVHAVTGSRTRKALLEWIDDHARDADELKSLLETLSGLQPGEAWVWSPGFLRLLKRVVILAITTFDSHATPEPGETVELPRRMADIDVAALTDELRETIERVKADDPKELRAKIADLERQLAGVLAAPPVQRVEVPVVTADDRALIEKLLKAIEGAQAMIGGGIERWATATHELADRIGERYQPPGAYAKVEGESTSLPITVTMPPQSPGRAKPAPARKPPAEREAPAVVEGTSLSKAEDALLCALVARHPIPMTLRELGVAARRSHTSSTTQTAVSHLRALGLAEGTNRTLLATQAGVDLVGHVEPMPSDRSLIEWWCSRLSTAEGALLRVLVSVYPKRLDNSDLAGMAGYSTTSSTFQTAMSRLRSLGLATRDGGYNTAADEVGEAWQRG